MKVLVMGASGMLGAMVTDFLATDADLQVSASVRSQGELEKGKAILPKVQWKIMDAADPASLMALLAQPGEYAWIVNAIGITKPLIRDDNAFEIERALRVNSLFPELLAKRAESMGARVLQIATDCVFSGQKGHYVETDVHDALDVYGKTKSLGEVYNPAVQHLRCSIIGPEPKEFKFLIEWFRRQPQGAQVNGFVNHQWNGVTTLQFAKICQGFMKSGQPLGHLQHMVPTATISKAEMLKVFAKAYKRPDIRINETEAGKVIDRTLATIQADANLAIWKAAGYTQPPTVAEMILEVAGYDFRLGKN
jgi:dTDP-4-dehydrorhamnose reductase